MKEYEGEVLQLYADIVEEGARMSGNRTKYQHLAQILSHMKTLENGTETVEQILKLWRERYYNRPAMMGELKHL